MSLAIVVIGAGRMGQAVASVAQERGHRILAVLDRHTVAELPAALAGADVAIEFTVPEAAAGTVRACIATGTPIVSGTTGWQHELDAVRAEVLAAHGTLFWAANFAIGVYRFTQLVERAAALLTADQGFDAHLIDVHHAAKRDAPSGTALALVAAARAAGGRPVPVTSVRTGAVPGTHEMVFDAAYETITLRHEARDRRVFAAGAIVAAEWVVGRTGVFTMSDMLDGEESQ